MEDAIQQLRITLWPGVKLPHPGRLEQLRDLRQGVIGPVGRVVGRVSDEARRFAIDEDGQDELRSLLAERERRALLRPSDEVDEAGEIYLELEAVNLDDDKEILLFVNRFGILGLDSDDCAEVRQLPWYANADEDQPFGNDWIRVNPYFGGTRRVAITETTAQFRQAAHILRDLKTAYECLRANKPEDMRWLPTATDLSGKTRAQELPGGATAATPRDDPARALATFFEHTLTSALTTFHPRLNITQPAHRPAHGWLAGATVSYFATCCLELHNHIVENATYRRCQNDHCGRTFVRQTGRAEAGQHRRHGILYCSNHCARATAQRRYRERQYTKNAKPN